MILTRCARALRKALTRGRITVPGRGGFTLVEIMMVLLILSVGVLPIALIQHRARREVTESDLYTRAVTLAQAQMERLKSQGFGNIVAQNGVDGPIAWNATVNNVAFGLDRVEVTVAWQEGGAPMNLTFANMVSMR